MNKIITSIVAGAVASVLVGGAASAMTAEEVNVSATRAVPKVVGRDASGAAIVNVTLSYGVSYAGLDLASNAGVVELTKRINDAAKAACTEIAKQNPLSNFQNDDASCAKSAADKAIASVQPVIAAAGKKGK